MANPKRRHSNTRSRLRRAHDAIKTRSLSQCPQCKAFIKPHRVCASCGFYRGKQVVSMKAQAATGEK